MGDLLLGVSVSTTWGHGTVADFKKVARLVLNFGYRLEESVESTLMSAEVLEAVLDCGYKWSLEELHSVLKRLKSSTTFPPDIDEALPSNFAVFSMHDPDEAAEERERKIRILLRKFVTTLQRDSLFSPLK